MKTLLNLFRDGILLLYPRLCAACGNDVFDKNLLCHDCIISLPHSGFANYENNPVERTFTGRLNIQAGHSEFYFSKSQAVQQLIHQLKYKGNKEVGFHLGELTGKTLLSSGRFNDIDYLIPLPLYPDKEARRGYNQAEIICNGISSSMKIPVMSGNVIRLRKTQTQTRKNRTERWENVEGSFTVRNPGLLVDKHVLLVDDVITTGATIESCGITLLKIKDTRISIASLALASK